MANEATQAKVLVFEDFSNAGGAKLTAAELTSKYSGYTLKTPNYNFSMAYRGHTVSFRGGIPVLCDAALLAALTAASAPVT